MNCAETAGFLFHHDCGREMAATCQLCGKAVCEMHTRMINAQILCIGCAKRTFADGLPPQAAPTAQTGLPVQAAPSAQTGVTPQAGATPPARPTYYNSPWYSHDDPFWYTDRHYHSYHTHDFTRDDRQAFDQPQQGTTPTEQGFETDPSAS